MQRIYHTWDHWECYPAGFYENRPPVGIADCRAAYAAFLRDLPGFRAALKRVLREWPNSCEHYLSNENMNRLAWLGQASVCIALGIPSAFRSGFHLLNQDEQDAANTCALEALNAWLTARGEPAIATVEEAASRTKPNLY